MQDYGPGDRIIFFRRKIDMKNWLICILLTIPAFMFAEESLLDAAKNGDAAFIKGYQGDLNAADNSGWTALTAAAFRGKTDSVNALIALKADVNATNNNGWTPLFAASWNGHTDIVKALIAAKADINAQIPPDLTTCLMAAAETGQMDTLKTLIAEKAKVNAVSHTGWSALMYAVENSKTEVVKVLLDAKADTGLVNHDGKTALTLARNDDIIKLLKDSSAK